MQKTWKITIQLEAKTSSLRFQISKTPETFTLPETNSSLVKIGLQPKRKLIDSNHSFSGAKTLVSGYIFVGFKQVGIFQRQKKTGLGKNKQSCEDYQKFQKLGELASPSCLKPPVCW